MRRPALLALPLALGALALAAAVPAALAAPARPAGPPDTTREHRRIVDFWTVDRVQQARPRDFVGTPGQGFRLAPAATTGKVTGARRPAGGGGSGTVLGSSWTGEGLVLRTTGKVFFSVGGTYYTCSGSVVTDRADNDRSIALTAGHCVYDQETHSFAENWMFVPDYDSAPASFTFNTDFCAQTTLGCWTSTRLVAHSGFTSQPTFNTAATLNDWGFAVLGAGGKTGDALLETVVGSQPFTTATQQTRTTVDAFGYPAAQPYTGTDLTYCQGPLGTDRRNGGRTWGVGCGMTGGSSGGPWFIPFSTSSGQGTQMSVNSYRYAGVNSMFGPVFNARTQATYDAALTATGNTVAG
jgi:V8-like Glu-specific endopeptidase